MPNPVAQISYQPPNPRKTEEVTLSGAGSKTAGGADYIDTPANLTFAWSLVVPRGSATTLNSNTVVNPIFRPDLVGTYVAQLVVTDPATNEASPRRECVIQVADIPLPKAVIKKVSGATVGKVVEMDGTGSRIVGGAAYVANPANMTFLWSLIPPNGSNATLNSETINKPSFTPDVIGNYTVSLIVTDTAANSRSPRVELVVKTKRQRTRRAYEWANGKFNQKPWFQNNPLGNMLIGCVVPFLVMCLLLLVAGKGCGWNGPANVLTWGVDVLKSHKENLPDLTENQEAELDRMTDQERVRLRSLELESEAVRVQLIKYRERVAAGLCLRAQFSHNIFIPTPKQVLDNVLVEVERIRSSAADPDSVPLVIGEAITALRDAITECSKGIGWNKSQTVAKVAEAAEKLQRWEATGAVGRELSGYTKILQNVTNPTLGH